MNRLRATIPDRSSRRRVLKECERCGVEFEIYHLTDRFCSQKCRNHHWNNQRAEAMYNYKQSVVRSNARNMPPEFVKGLSLNLEDLEPRQIEARPTFEPSLDIVPEVIACIYCGKVNSWSTIHCGCEGDPKDTSEAGEPGSPTEADKLSDLSLDLPITKK